MNKKIIFSLGIVVGFIVASTIVVYAANLILGSEVNFDNSKTGLSSTNVNDAITELYEMIDGTCPTGYKCSYIGECSYELGKEWNFSYTGAVEEFIIPCTGLYKLEVWGGGGNGAAAGGYSEGYKYIEAETPLYVCNGQNGLNGKQERFNGGGKGGGDYGSSGAGATHIALVPGTLASIGYDEFVTNKKGLIVAGGGGGYGGWWSSGYGYKAGGVGGGAVGGNGSAAGSGSSGGTGGTISSGASFGKGGNSSAGGHMNYGGGGGGGLYGGYAGYSGSNAEVTSSGGGGSGYIGGVLQIDYEGVTYSPTTTSGVNNDNGKARITLIAR